MEPPTLDEFVQVLEFREQEIMRVLKEKRKTKEDWERDNLEWDRGVTYPMAPYSTPEQSAALAGFGKEAVGKPGYATRGGRPPRRAPASQQVTLPPPQKPKVLYYPRCGKGGKGPCWIDISNKTECSVQVDMGRHMYSGAEATWDGECESNAAHGRGTLRFKFNGVVRDESTGEMVRGIKHGHWAQRWRNKLVSEGPYVDGKRHGQWVKRFKLEPLAKPGGQDFFG